MKRLSALLLALLLLLSACGLDEGQLNDARPHGTGPIQMSQAQPDTLEVHFIDVGQADCALLRAGDYAMLIDGGNVDDSSLVVSYLLQEGIETLDCVVATHAHEDHAGGLGGILAVFPVESVYVTTTTYASQCYDDFMRYVDQQNITPNIPQPGDRYRLGDCEVTFLGPVKSYAETNDTSLVCRVDYGQTSFLFTGDMETAAEGDMLDAGADVRADVLKVGHHGSSTSTSYRFLYEVDPEYAVISCGEGNSYGHPHEEVISRLRDGGVTTYRTDLAGTVIAVTDGETITFSTGSQVLPETGRDRAENQTFIGNKNSGKFHTDECKNLPREENRLIFGSYEEATQAGYTPCGNCIG